MAKRVLFISQEIEPYVPPTELAQMGKTVPLAVASKGYEIRTFMPKFGCINERRNQLHEVLRLSGMNLIIDNTDHQLLIKVATIPGSRVQVYFIDNYDYFYKRRGDLFRDDKTVEYADNGERAVFFARGVLETMKKLRWAPDIVHCQGWMASLIPFYIRKTYYMEPCFADVKIVTTLYDHGMRRELSKNFKKSVVHDEVTLNMLDKYNPKFDYNELSKLAIDYSDGLVMGVEEDELSEKILKYANKSGKPILDFQEDDAIADTYTKFYEGLW